MENNEENINYVQINQEMKNKLKYFYKIFGNFLKSETMFKIKRNRKNKPKIVKYSKVRNKNKMRSPIFVKRSLDPFIFFFQNSKIKKSIFKHLKQLK